MYYGPQRERLRHRLKRQWDRVRAGRSPGPDSDDDVEEEEDEHDGSASGEGEEEEEDEEQQQDGDDDVVIVNGAGRSRSTVRRRCGGHCNGALQRACTWLALPVGRLLPPRACSLRNTQHASAWPRPWAALYPWGRSASLPSPQSKFFAPDEDVFSRARATPARW